MRQDEIAWQLHISELLVGFYLIKLYSSFSGAFNMATSNSKKLIDPIINC